MTDRTIKRKKQVDQSTKWLVEGLLQLMERKNYSDITVQDIATRAGLSRRTFYRHFDSINALLLVEIKKVVLNLFDFLKKEKPQNFSELVVLFFIFWEQQKILLELLNKNNLVPLLITELSKESTHSLLGEIFLEDDAYAYSFALGGISNLLTTWIKRGMVESPMQLKGTAEEISNHLRNIL
ncbi:MAG: TetR/AcrR family transcriptional regulator [Enterococcus sp.]